MSIWDNIKVSSKQTGPGTTPTVPALTIPAEPPTFSPPSDPTPAAKAGGETFELPEALRGRYKVEAKVGKGAFGTALLVSDKASGEKYVAKVMNLSQMSPKDKQHVKSEIDCLSQCDHVNIIRQIDSYADDTTLVLMMEYADGGDLGHEILARKKKNLPFTSTEIACVIAQICLALDYVHAKGILHRDVKPANIFFTHGGIVKIGDFGFSKHYEETLSNAVGHTLCGTPCYLSPEMWRGEHYSKKAEVWSVGIVIFEMMMLKRPFMGDSMKQLSHAVRKGTIPAIPAGYFDVELVRACNLLLSVDTVSRPEFRDVLKLSIFHGAPTFRGPAAKANGESLELPEAMRGRYKVESKVGQGAFGTALLVTGKASKEMYVAKVMNLSQMSPKDKQHVKSEIDCLSQCDHVNIIRYIESYADDTTLVLVTEYADGGVLSNEILARKKKKHSFTSTEIATIFVQICLALDHAHVKGILHRDIKPANIFFTRRGLVKIGDFGFSKHYEETLSNAVGHTLCGTPCYLSPEMWRGGQYSKKAEIWSVGIVIFEMMTLTLPFMGDSMKQLSDTVGKGTIPAITAKAVDVELVQACNLLLLVETVDRPEFRDVLKFNIFQSALKAFSKLLGHAYFVNVREATSAHIGSFLTKGK